LLLALPAQSFHDYIFVPSRFLHVLKWGLFLTRRGSLLTALVVQMLVLRTHVRKEIIQMTGHPYLNETVLMVHNFGLIHVAIDYVKRLIVLYFILSVLYYVQTF
jgi:hypothetical protein